MNQITGDQITTVPFLTQRKAETISSAFNPVSSTWTQTGTHAMTGLIHPDFRMSRLVWNTQNTVEFLSSGGFSTDTRVDLASSQMWIPGTTGATTVTLAHKVSFQAPYFAISAKVVSGFGAGSAESFEIRYGNGTDYWWGKWDQAAGNVSVGTFISGVSSGALNTVGFSGTSMFELALVFNNTGLSLQTCTLPTSTSPASQWRTLAKHAFNAAIEPDWRKPANLAANDTVTLAFSSTGNSGSTFKLGEIQSGYLQGFNSLVDQPMTFSDRTPIQKDGEQYVIGYVDHAPTGINGITDANCAIFAIDPTRNSQRITALVYVERVGVAEGYTIVVGENSGTVVYHPADDTWYWMITNYGTVEWDSNSGGNIHNLHFHMYKTKGFPRGIVILRNGVQVVTPQTASFGEGDPTLGYNLSGTNLWHLGFSAYDSGSFAPVHVTATDLTAVGTAGSWTTVFAKTVTGNSIEGDKFYKLGGTTYFTAASGGGCQIFSMSGTLLGSFTIPGATGGVAPHACLLVYHEGNGKQMTWMCWFDHTRSDAASDFTWGRTRFDRSTFLQVGHDFDQRILLDA